MTTFDNESLEDDILADYGVEFAELHQQAESDILRLEREPDHADTLNALFRCIHTIKGNAGLLGIEPIVVLLQELESILHLVRSGELAFSVMIGDLTLLVLDQCANFIRSMCQQRPVEYDAGLFESVNRYLAEASGQQGVPQQKALTRALMYLDPNTVEFDIPQESKGFLETLGFLDNSDLSFIYQSALVAQQRADFWQGRLNRVIHWLLKFNQRLDHPLSPETLVAAACIHDLSMAFLPATLINKQDRLTLQEKGLMQQHVDLGASMARSFPQWQEVSLLLLHHHQRLDGSGYPAHAQALGITIGSQMLAIVHTYEAITHRYSKDVRRKRPLMRAVMELNAGAGIEYQEHLVQVFLSILNE